jgi:DNA-binding SARP family transcriptional activator
MTAVTDWRWPQTDQVIEIRMLGALQVLRLDQTLVGDGEWRTGKTADMIRILALHAGEPVPASVLIAALWPAADQVRAQASLRTATFRIRSILGRDCLERDLSGLRLRGVWVDAVAFRAHAVQVRRLVRAGDPAGALLLAREADALHRGDLRAHDESADWVAVARQGVDGVYRDLLRDAADAAASLGLARDALDFGTRALARDPFDEHASRLVMRAHVDLGETSFALREYERCRSLLVEELGVDPSPLTRALHLEIVRA